MDKEQCRLSFRKNMKNDSKICVHEVHKASKTVQLYLLPGKNLYICFWTVQRFNVTLSELKVRFKAFKDPRILGKIKLVPDLINFGFTLSDQPEKENYGKPLNCQNENIKYKHQIRYQSQQENLLETQIKLLFLKNTIRPGTEWPNLSRLGKQAKSIIGGGPHNRINVSSSSGLGI
uniref:Uncharacterized protein n=1 Tax=Romanomermis culicivorax TaxID=13658 RepID=A0A915I9U5_ROMCU